MFYVYVLESKSEFNLYIGSTNDLKRRLKEHNDGKNIATKPYRPWNLVYYEASLSLEDAFRRERYLKTTIGRRMLRRRLRSHFSV